MAVLARGPALRQDVAVSAKANAIREGSRAVAARRGNSGARARAIPHLLGACRQGPCAIRKRPVPFEPVRPSARAMAEAATRRLIRRAGDPVQRTSECAKARYGARRWCT